MTAGEKIRACRQRAGMSQEMLAGLTGVSRQAVTKWETGRSVPSTENLFRLAEIFGTTVDTLLAPGEEAAQSPAEQMYRLFTAEEEKKAALRRQTRKKNLRTALLIAAGYMVIYLIGRVLWCDFSQSTLLGWLFTARPSGEHSYLYGWLLSSGMFRYAAVISVLSTLLGKHRFAGVTLSGFAVGLTAGMLFGPYPQGAAAGHGHYGWAIWGAVFLVSAAAGVLAEKYRKKE